MIGKHSALKPHGYGIWTGDGSPQEMDSLRCCHCGTHFWVTPGSGKRRGYCMNCGDVTCGSELCDLCVPLEQQLQNREQGKPLDHRPIQASVPAGVPKTASGILIGKA